MSWHELFTAGGGTIAGLSFLVDYLHGVPAYARTGTSVAIVVSAAGIAALVGLLMLRAVFGWPAWVVYDAMGILAMIMFPIWQLRMRRLRREEIQP
jgi:uncharacterized membrane protein YfcA